MLIRNDLQRTVTGIAGGFLCTDRAESQESICIGLRKPETLRRGLKVIESIAPRSRGADRIARFIASGILFHYFRQSVSDRADIADAENNLPGQFMFNRKVVVLRVRHCK